MIQMLKEDLRSEQGLSQDKLQLAIEKEVNLANRSLNSTLNDVILVQLQALDAHQETLAEQMSTINLASSADAIRMGNISDMFAKHMTLMEALTRSVVGRAQKTA